MREDVCRRPGQDPPRRRREEPTPWEAQPRTPGDDDREENSFGGEDGFLASSQTLASGARRGYDRGPVPRAAVPPGGPGSAGRKPATPAIITARTLAVLGAAIVMAVCGYTYTTYRSLTTGLQTSDATSEIRSGNPGYVAPHLGSDANVLLIGLDSRKDMSGNDLPKDIVEGELHAGSSVIGGNNTNVLILMRIPANGGRVTAFSIPRDDYVEEPGGASSVGTIPDLGRHKMKEAYGRAEGIARNRLITKG